VLLECWALVEKHGGKPTIKAVMRMAREAGARFDEHRGREILRPLLTALPLGHPAPTPQNKHVHPAATPSPPRKKAAAAEVAFGPDERVVSDLLRVIAAENKTGVISVEREGRLRAELYSLREEYGRETWSFGVGQAIGHDAGLRYAEVVMKNVKARTERQGVQQASLFTANGRATHTGENLEGVASRFQRIRGIVPDEET